MSWCQQEVTHHRRALMNPTSTTWNGANDFVEVKTIWWYKVQGGGHERMKRQGIAADEMLAGLVNSLSDFSWTYRRHWNGLVALTPIWMVRRTNGDMTGERNNPTQLNHGDEVKVSCSRATCYHKVIYPFSHFPQTLLTNTSYFFNKPEEDNICL